MSRKVAVIFVPHLIVVREKIITIIKDELKRINQIATGRLNYSGIHFLSQSTHTHKKREMGH